MEPLCNVLGGVYQGCCADLHGDVADGVNGLHRLHELLSNLVFEGCWSCGDLVGVCGFDSVFERDACDDFSEVVKAA
jgi:hypothetical protein